MGSFAVFVLFSLFAIRSSFDDFVSGTLSKCCPLNYELSVPKSYVSRNEKVSSGDLRCRLSTTATLSVTYTKELTVYTLPLCRHFRLVNAYDRYRAVACMDRIGQFNDVFALKCIDDHDDDDDDDDHHRQPDNHRGPTSTIINFGKKKSTIAQQHNNHHDDHRPNDHNQYNNGDNDISEDSGSSDDSNNQEQEELQQQEEEQQHQQQTLPSKNAFHVSTLTNVRKCCPPYRRYAADRQYCWSPFSANHTNALLDLLKITLRRVDRFVNVTFGAPPCRSSNVLVDAVVPSNQISFQNDALELNGAGADGASHLYSFDEYCADVVDDLFEYVVVRACRDYRTECQLKGRLCVRKCCPPEYEYEGRACVPSQRPLALTVYNVTQTVAHYPPQMVVQQMKPAFLLGDVCGMGKYALDERQNAADRHVLTVAGTVLLTARNIVHSTDEYCVENRKSNDRTLTMLCFAEEEPAESGDYLDVKVRRGVVVSCAAVSAFFLLFTFFIYLLLPSLHNLHGKLVMCYLLTSALSYVTVVVTGTIVFERLPKGVCVAVGYIMQFTFLSSFSWLNIISYDIWSTFKAVRSAFLKKSSAYKKFILSCLYGWGMSCLWTMSTFVCQYTSIISNASAFKPDIGKFRCFFAEDGKSKIVFFVAPILAMISFNIIIFIFTVKYCANIRTELKKSNNNYSLKRFCADKNELIINLKLFLVMGLNWSMELTSLLVQPNNRTFFIISDLMNGLGGAFIFCIFILKRKVLLELKEKLCGQRSPNGRKFERATGCTASTTSSIVLNLMNARRSVSLNP